MKGLLTSTQIQRTGRVINWAEQQMGMNPEAPPSRPNQQTNLALRGYLLQNIYGGGSGLMALAYRTESPVATEISIIGENYVDQSQFKLQLSGTLAPTTANPSPAATSLFTTQPIPVNTDAPTLQALLMLAAQGANQPVTSGDITVLLGNPMSLPDAVLLSPQQTDVVTSGEDLLSYIGSWIIQLDGALTKMYPALTWTIVQDTTAFMRGASGLVQRQAVDVPGTTTQIVFDVQNRPIDYPWVAGSLCGVAWYADLGYGIQWSDHRSQTISIPTTSS